MSSPWGSAAAVLVSDLQRIFGARLHAVVAYGPQLDGDGDAPLACLGLVESLAIGDLEECARLASQWGRRGLATPLILPKDEFRRSLDAFPLEFGEIIRAHERVFGDDPFAAVSISHDDLRRACETQVKGHLLHLREGFIEAAGRPQAIAELVSASAPAFAALLRNIARLNGAPAANHAEATEAGARAAGLPDGAIRDVLALERHAAIPTTDAARLFPDYLAAVEQLARTVDAWRAETPS
jgi:hypothetical protein